MIENKEEILKTRLQKEARRTLNHSKLPKFNTTILYSRQQYCMQYNNTVQSVLIILKCKT